MYGMQSMNDWSLEYCGDDPMVGVQIILLRLPKDYLLIPLI